MKTLEKHQIIYDDECPLCNAYTNAFVKNGMLDKSGRVPYKAYAEANEHNIDLLKSQNQIALINTKTGETTYGLASILKIIEYRFPLVKAVFGIKFVYWFFTKMYSFISYNRKVIAPSKITTYSCYPNFSIKYRLLFIAFCWVIATIVLQAFTATFHFKNYPNFVESFILLLQIPVQYFFIQNKTREVFINYLGHLFFLSLLGSILLLPIIIFNHYLIMPLLISTAYFFLIVLFLINIHFKRIALLGLNRSLCFSWIGFRFVLLVYILISNYL